jgi:hypothetical protein
MSLIFNRMATLNAPEQVCTKLSFTSVIPTMQGLIDLPHGNDAAPRATARVGNQSRVFKRAHFGQILPFVTKTATSRQGQQGPSLRSWGTRWQHLPVTPHLTVGFPPRSGSVGSFGGSKCVGQFQERYGWSPFFSLFQRGYW